MNKYLYITHLVILSASLIVCLIKLKQLPDIFRIIALLLFVAVAVESFAFYLMLEHKRSPQFLYHFFLPFYYSLMSYVYYRSIHSRIRNLILWSIPVFLLTHLLLSLFYQKLDELNGLAFGISSSLIIAWCLYYFYSLFTDKLETVSLTRTPLFWISAANLFFYTGTFFLMGVLNYLLKEDKVLAGKLFTINYLLNFILYGTYIIGFLSVKKKAPTAALV